LAAWFAYDAHVKSDISEPRVASAPESVVVAHPVAAPAAAPEKPNLQREDTAKVAASDEEDSEAKTKATSKTKNKKQSKGTAKEVTAADDTEETQAASTEEIATEEATAESESNAETGAEATAQAALPAFDKSAAVAALSAAGARASACRKPGDPAGHAQVIVTFAPSGRVTTATVNGFPFAGTTTGSCIASTMRQAKVPAFSGSFVTVSKTVVVN
jgi:hypothetical protein